MLKEDQITNFLTTVITSNEDIASVVMLDQLPTDLFKRTFELLVNRRIGISDIRGIVGASNPEEQISAIEDGAYLLKESSFTEEVVAMRERVLLSQFAFPDSTGVQPNNVFKSQNSLEAKLDLNIDRVDITDLTAAVKVGAFNSICYANETALAEAFYEYVTRPQIKSIDGFEENTTESQRIELLRKYFGIGNNIESNIGYKRVDPLVSPKLVTPEQLIVDLFNDYCAAQMFPIKDLLYSKPYRYFLRINDNMTFPETNAEFFNSFLNFNLFGGDAVKALDEICHELINIETEEKRASAVISYLHKNLARISFHTNVAKYYGLQVTDKYTLLCGRRNFNNTLTRIYYAARWFVYNHLTKNNTLNSSVNVTLPDYDSQSGASKEVNITYTSMKNICSLCERIHDICSGVKTKFQRFHDLSVSELFTRELI